MPGGRRSRGQAGLAVLPQEILQDILIRLPAKSVLRCRAVCRLWRRLTTDPAFLVAHHRSQPTLHLVRSNTGRGKCEWYSIGALHLQKAERQPVSWPRWSLFDASCDGLVVIGDSICNPATRQWAPLSQQKVRFENIVSLYRHQPSEEYRVLFWTHSNHPSELYCPNDYFVHTVGSKKPRRAICSVTLVDEELKLELSGKGPDIRGAAVHLHGNLYIHLKKSNVSYHGILVFNTVAESFRQMRPPAVAPGHILHLFDMDGMLAASCSKDAMKEMRIFALQNYETEVWSFQYRIKLPEMEIRQFQEQGDWFAKIVSEEGDLLVTCFGWILHCDRKGNLLSKFEYDDDIPVAIPCTLKESLIQHPFFEEKQKISPYIFRSC
ncbi:hypothetical protein HU200_048064 [Digitaria exilis]|uniref:F-box domain-containing protein n=1 Tax=Digitaria exilis TaxID=1010633 RepID=A0A835ATC2_9POAL|nr:hypothetical protein HU200_048064 [Digitaria exilis]CAB3486548.1 unnamed protein product [Digitaria exilis]